MCRGSLVRVRENTVSVKEGKGGKKGRVQTVCSRWRAGSVALCKWYVRGLRFEGGVLKDMSNACIVFLSPF